jgi:hypothetical protein
MRHSQQVSDFWKCDLTPLCHNSNPKKPNPIPPWSMPPPLPTVVGRVRVSASPDRLEWEKPGSSPGFSYLTSGLDNLARGSKCGKTGYEIK